MAEAEPYIQHQRRQVMFREAVLNFMGFKDEEAEVKQKQAEYCAACRQAGKAKNCKTCPGANLDKTKGA